MQRTGRKGYAQFRIVVQDSRQTPSSARVIASIGHYNPHTKEVVIDVEKAKFYLKNGAQPSARVVSLLKKEGVKMPAWVEPVVKQKKVTKHPEKLRKNRPVEPVKKEETPEAEPEAAEITTEPDDASQDTTETAVEAPAEEIAVEAQSQVEPKVEESDETEKETSDTQKDIELEKEPKAPTKSTIESK